MILKFNEIVQIQVKLHHKFHFTVLVLSSVSYELQTLFPAFRAVKNIENRFKTFAQM